MGKIGIMGGTFDPIHNGHLLLGRQAYQEYHLDQVWFMPSGHPPHKRDHKITSRAARCQMAKLAIEGHSYFSFSDFEVWRGGNTYTSQTLELLRRAYPSHAFYFIIGADSLYEIEHWHEPAKVMALATLLVAGREYGEARLPIQEQISYLKEKYQARICQLHCVELDVSSAQIRRMAAMGEDLGEYVPGKVAEYIRRHHLYEEVI